MSVFNSTNILVLKKRPSVFFENERQITILETENFGRLAFIEVGAMCVGKIIQTYKGIVFRRGEMKGYFDFGASTVVVLGEKGKWIPSNDILKNTKENIETNLINLI